MNQTSINVFFFSLIFLFGATIEDRCTKHSHPSGNIEYNLTECPSSEKFNLLECYDEVLQVYRNQFNTVFFCWSRRDVDESIIKNISISTARVKDDDLIEKINKPFSAQFTFNGTHLKCDTMEKWATESIDVNATTYCSSLSCVTSAKSVAKFKYCTMMEYDGL